MDAWKECVFYILKVKHSINVNYILLIDSIIQFFYIFTNFCPVLWKKLNVGHSCPQLLLICQFPLSCLSSVIFFMYVEDLLFCVYTFRITMSLGWIKPIIIIWCSSLSLVIILAMWCILIWIKLFLLISWWH